MRDSYGNDHAELEFGIALNSTFTASSKSLRIQIGTEYTPGMGWNAAFADVYAGNWCFFAPPMPPTADADGQVSAGCETITARFGDQIVCLGQRDVRWSKFAQDMIPGESAFFNAFGSRWLLGKKFASLAVVGGAFMNFDITKNLVTLSGFPNSAKNAAYMTVSTTKIGLTSPGGASSIVVSDNGVTINAKAATIGAGMVRLGLGGQDPIVVLSSLAELVAQLVVWANSHTHASFSAFAAPPLALTPSASSTCYGTP